MLLGNGACDARKEILEFINTKLQIPTVVSLKALDILPSNNDAYIGMVGSFGHRSANLAIKHCDLLLVLGSRLDERQAGFIKNEFAPNATVVRVDIDKTEITRKVDSKYSVCTSVKNFINSLMRYEYSDTNCVKYLNLLKQLKIAYPSYCTCEGGDVNNFIRNLTKELDDWSIITSDVGITQMCVAQSVYIKEGNRVLNSAGLGSMGYSLPAAIGSSYALGNKKKIISFSGDGGLQMNIQELQLIDANKLPIFVVCLNNTCLGMIRNLQDNLFDSNYIGSVDGYSVPDFSKIANAYNLRYMCVENLDNYKDVIEFIKDNPRGFIEVKLPQKTLAHPMPGKKIYEQTPIIENIERWFE